MTWSIAPDSGVISIVHAVSAAQAATPAPPAISANPSPMSEKDFAALQDQFLQTIRLSPPWPRLWREILPSLDPEYVNRNNPELGRFLQSHPEIAHNPDFYLLIHLHGEHEPPSQAAGAQALA